MIITNSEMGSWLHCQRCWYLTYYRNLRRIRDYKKTLSVGSMYHRALEVYYREGEHPVDAVKAMATRMIEEVPEAAADIAKDAELVGIMANGYMNWLAETGADANLEVYSTEQKLSVPMFPAGDAWPTGLELFGKLDARAYIRSTGHRSFLEHKTCGSLGDLPKTAQTNSQFRSYFLLELLNAADGADATDRCDSLLLNMAKKNKQTARAKPPFYDRVEVRYNLAEIRNHWRHVVGVATEIQSARIRLDSGEDIAFVCPPTSTRECFWKCGMSSVCQTGMMDDGSDWEGYLSEFFEVWDPMTRYDDEDEEEE